MWPRRLYGGDRLGTLELEKRVSVAVLDGSHEAEDGTQQVFTHAIGTLALRSAQIEGSNRGWSFAARFIGRSGGKRGGVIRGLGGTRTCSPVEPLTPGGGRYRTMNRMAYTMVITRGGLPRSVLRS